MEVLEQGTPTFSEYGISINIYYYNEAQMLAVQRPLLKGVVQFGVCCGKD